MTTKVASLAHEIAVLEENEQRALWEQVADLNYRRGLRALTDQYRKRLQQQGELNRSAEEILAELNQTREETVAYATYSEVQELVAQLPVDKLPILYDFLVDLGESQESALLPGRIHAVPPVGAPSPHGRTGKADGATLRRGKLGASRMAGGRVH